MPPVKSSTPHNKRDKLLSQRRRSSASLTRRLSAEQLAFLQHQRRLSRGRLVSGQQLISEIYLKKRRRSSNPRYVHPQDWKQLKKASTVAAFTVPPAEDDNQSKRSPSAALSFLRKQKLLKRTKKKFKSLRKPRKHLSVSSLSGLLTDSRSRSPGAILCSTINDSGSCGGEEEEVDISGLITFLSEGPQDSSVHQPRDDWLDFSSPTKLFESLIYPIPPQEFFKSYWEKQPLLLKGNRQSSESVAAVCASIFSLADMKVLVRDASVLFGANVNVCRYEKGRRRSMNRKGKLTSEHLDELWKKAATFQFHQPQQFKVTQSAIQECMYVSPSLPPSLLPSLRPSLPP